MKPEPVVYFPPFWVHNRAIVTCRGGHEWVVRRLRLAESEEASTLEVLPVHVCDDRELREYAVTYSLKDFLGEFKPTGRQMSIFRAPL